MKTQLTELIIGFFVIGLACYLILTITFGLYQIALFMHVAVIIFSLAASIMLSVISRIDVSEGLEDEEHDKY